LLVLYFITRKSALPDADFYRYWREVHGPIAEKIPQLKRYIQSHRAAFPGTISPYDGAAEVWVEDEAALQALRRSPEYLNGALADEPNFIDMLHVEWVVANDHVILDRVPTAQSVKGVFQWKPKPGMPLKEFRAYWRDRHGPVVRKLPGLQRYMQCHTVDAAYNNAEPRWDGVAQLWAESVDAFQRMLESKEFTEGSWPDGVNFLDQNVISSFVA
jgi:uncharacterized protein (TIGR02118 family)